MKMRLAKLGKPSSRKGAHLSEDTKEKIRQAHLGLLMHPNTKAALTTAYNPRSKGARWKHTPETIEKMKQVQSNAPWKKLPRKNKELCQTNSPDSMI
jgi:hypothetical protein